MKHRQCLSGQRLVGGRALITVSAQVLVLLSVLTGCSDGSPTETPPEPFEVSLTLAVTDSGFDPVDSTWTCGYTVTAVASGGSAGEAATWQASTRLVRFVGDTAVDPPTEIVLSAAEMGVLFGSSTIASGEMQSREIRSRSNRRWADFSWIVGYSVGADQRSDTLNGSCT